MSLVKEVARAEEQGAKRVEGFTGAVRSMDNLALEKGDKFTFPAEYKVYEQKFGTGTGQFIFVELEDEKGKKTDVVKQFYPSTFTKRRTIYNEDGTSTGRRVATKGTAADLYRSVVSVSEGMDLLKGKTVVVSDIIVVKTLRYGTDQVVEAQIPVIDLVEKAA